VSAADVGTTPSSRVWPPHAVSNVSKQT
jgi:hypothetical protein